jgi:hypothetical protein
VRWIREQNLEHAHEVEIAEENNALVISAENQVASTKVAINLEKGIADYYRIMIENQYLRGTDVLDITFSEPAAFSIIQEVVRNLIGFEIVEQGTTSCRISQTAMPTSREVSTLQRRFFNIMRYGQGLLMEALEKDVFDHWQTFETFIADCRRYSLFCRRAMHKMNLASRTDEVFLDLLLERLIIAAYHCYYIYAKIAKQQPKGKLRKEVVDLFKRAMGVFDIFSEMYAKKDMSRFAAINDLWEQIYFKEGHKLLANCNEKESIVLFHSMSYTYVLFLVAQPNTVLAGTLMNMPEM